MPTARPDPFAHGMLPTSDGNQIYWETSGNPDGKPVLYLHGGPGSGLKQGFYRQLISPERHLIIGLDQRGCGRSTPLVIDALDSIGTNTTDHLIADIEGLRTHLGIERWLVTGLSWGCTLGLAYAQRHPDRVSELVLCAVTTTSRESVDWITEGVGRVFPEAWERFDEEAGRHGDERPVEAYARRLATGDAEDRERAAASWDEWEAAHIAFDAPEPVRPLHPDARTRAVFATLVTHYWAHDGFLTDGREIMTNMGRIAHIPAILIHGRRDISSPMITPWRLHKQWPASQLTVVAGDGHGGDESFALLRQGIDSFLE
jgi:proline iminopeptidase